MAECMFPCGSEKKSVSPLTAKKDSSHILSASAFFYFPSPTAIINHLLRSNTFSLKDSRFDNRLSTQPSASLAQGPIHTPPFPRSAKAERFYFLLDKYLLLITLTFFLHLTKHHIRKCPTPTGRPTTKSNTAQTRTPTTPTPKFVP